MKNAFFVQTAAVSLLLLMASDAFAQFCAEPMPPPPPPIRTKEPACGGPGGGGGSGGGGGGAGSGVSDLTGGPGGSSASSGGSAVASCDRCAGSPCHVATGNYITAVMDMVIATNGHPLAISRKYESALPIDGIIGIGWTSNLASRLYFATYLFAAPDTYRREADVVLPSGERYRFVENPDGSFSPPQGRHDILVRNADGSFDLEIADASTKYHFGASGRLETIADEFGNALTFTYDATDRLERVMDSSGSGRYLDIYYGAAGRISSIEDNSGRQISYGYDASGSLTSVTDAAGRTTSYAYSAIRFGPLLTRITDPWGRVVTDVTYDARARTTSYTEEGESFVYTYDYNGRQDQSSKVDSVGNRWVYTFGSEGVITERIYPGGSAGSVIYNADFTVQTSTDETGVKTHYTYGPRARVASVTRDYEGTSAVRFDYTYDPAFPTKVTSVMPKVPATGAHDPDWQGWRYEYLQAGSNAPGALWKVFRVRSDGVTEDLQMTYAYNVRGHITSETDAIGAVTDYGYDSAGNLVTITAPANNDAGTRPVITYGYDSLGRVTSVTDPLGKVTTYTYDAMDRVVSATLPKPSASSPLVFTTTTAYDQYDAASGLLFENVTDPNGNVTRQGYDQFWRLSRSVDALGGVTAFGYSRGLLVTIADENDNITRYEYDAQGRLSSTVFPDSARESYTYHADGMLHTKTDRKPQSITHEFDAFKRLKKKIYSNQTFIEYSYEGQKLVQVLDTSVAPNESHTFSYDTAFREISETQGSRGTINYNYAPNDSVTSYSVTGGSTTSYTYYPDGSLNTVQWTPVTGEFKYHYNPAGQYQTITFPNGQTRNYEYDDQGRLSLLSNEHPATGNLATYSYAYDLNHLTGTFSMMGQRVSMTADVPAQNFTGALTKYSYDGNYRLTRVEYPSGAPFNGETHQWAYDAAGNRITNQINGTILNYTYHKVGGNPKNWHRLLSDGIVSYATDPNGAVQTLGETALSHDIEQRVATIGSSSFRYDYRGRRTTIDGTSDVVYVSAGAIKVSSAEYLFGDDVDGPLVRAEGGALTFYNVDPLGSAVLENSLSGSVSSSRIFNAWGGLVSPSTTTANHGFTGRPHIREDLVDLRARIYAPSIGRFLEEDPIRQEGGTGMNFYPYALSSPIHFTDPSGLAPLPHCVKHILSEWFPDLDLDDVSVHPKAFPKWFPVDAVTPWGRGPGSFTFGRKHIYFRSGAYRPHTARGIALIGHELVHHRHWSRHPVSGGPRYIKHGMRHPTSIRYPRRHPMEREAYEWGDAIRDELIKRYGDKDPCPCAR